MIFKFTKMKSISYKKGFVLLFAVVLSAIIFSIVLGMINISLKEVNFGTSARATNEAFFAADTGAECALFYDIVPAQSFFGPVDPFTVDSNETNATCGGSVIDLNQGAESPFLNNDPDGPWQFIVPALGENQDSCAIVRVTRTVNPIDSSISTEIISRGYNIGGHTPDCTSTNNNRVERVLELTY